MAIPYGIKYWHDQVSRNGIRGDVLNSMLQKSIRRGEEGFALAAAYEMYITSPDYLEMLWLRLQCIAIEDIGFGMPEAGRLVRTLDEMRKEFPYEDGDQALFFVQAVRFLCRCTKERTSDHLRGMLKRAFDNGYVPQVPDWDLDMHTARGREMGRDKLHFAQEASRVFPQMQDDGVQAIHQQYLDMLKNGCRETGEPETEPLQLNGWQY